MMKLSYNMKTGYNLPNLTLPVEPTVTGKYAMLRESFLQNHRRNLYLNLLTSGKLNQHLMEIQTRATEMMEQMMPQLQKKAGITENLKQQNPLEWAGLMNSLRHSAEETILNDLIYS